MNIGPKRRQVLGALAVLAEPLPLAWLKLPNQHLAARLRDEKLIRFIGNPPYLYITRRGRKALSSR